jgi:hypothetical protein
VRNHADLYIKYASEIMPTKIRATGVACGYVVFNAMGVLMTQTAPIAIAAITWKYFIIWLVFDCLYVVIVYFYYPETKNKTLEDLAGVFGDQVAESWEETKQYVEGKDGFEPVVAPDGKENIAHHVEETVR